MKPAPFEYHAPDSLDAALALRAEHGDDSKLLAGGQSLIPVLNFRLAKPERLIDLNRVAALDWVREGVADGPAGSVISIGAMTRQRRLEREGLIAEKLPLLAAAMPHVAHPQIRNRGTVGGSLAHADPAAELPAVAVALGARFRLASTAGERWVAAEDFYLSLFTTAIEPPELLAEVEIPAMAPTTGWSFLEVARRHGDYAQVGVAALVELDDGGRCRRARWVYLSVGDVPVVARRAAETLVGEIPTAEAVEAAAHFAASEEVEPCGDIHATADYKRHLTGVLTRRALTEAFARAEAAP